MKFRNARSRHHAEPEKFFRRFGRGFGDFFASDTPRAVAIVSATSRVCAGSQRFPRNGTGARYGQSVSTMNFQSGTCAATSRTLSAILESDDAGEGNEMIERDDFVRLLARAAEAMEDAAQVFRRTAA